MKKLNLNMVALLLLSCVGTTFSMEDQKNRLLNENSKLKEQFDYLKNKHNKGDITFEDYQKEIDNILSAQRKLCEIHNFEKYKTEVENSLNDPNKPYKHESPGSKYHLEEVYYNYVKLNILHNIKSLILH